MYYFFLTTHFYIGFFNMCSKGVVELKGSSYKKIWCVSTKNNDNKNKFISAKIILFVMRQQFNLTEEDKR